MSITYRLDYTHSNIGLFCQQIYAVFGIGFLDYYLHAFRSNLSNHYTTQQVIDIMDKKCHGLVRCWAQGLLKEKGETTVN